MYAKVVDPESDLSMLLKSCSKLTSAQIPNSSFKKASELVIVDKVTLTWRL